MSALPCLPGPALTVSSADIGLIGLAVMGQNLILNMNDKGFTVACYNRCVACCTQREKASAV